MLILTITAPIISMKGDVANNSTNASTSSNKGKKKKVKTESFSSILAKAMNM